MSHKRAATPDDDVAESSKAPETPVPNKKRSKPTNLDKETVSSVGRDGEKFWDLSNNRKVSVSSFKDITMVHIREFYESGGVSKPGRKGISLTIPQYRALIMAMPGIEEALAARNEVVPRPPYDQDFDSTAGEEDASRESDKDYEDTDTATGEDEDDVDEFFIDEEDNVIMTNKTNKKLKSSKD